MKKMFLILISVTLAAAFFLFACNSNEDLSINQEEVKVQVFPETLVSEAFVSSEQAIEIANAFFDKHATNSGITSRAAAISFEKNVNIEAVEENNNPLMYVVNFPEGGFVIVSASRNYYPVLAYSDENSFELNADMGPVSVWLEETKEAIMQCESLDDSTKSAMHASWKMYEKSDDISSSISLRKGDPNPYAAMGMRINELMSLYGSSWHNIYSFADAYFLDYRPDIKAQIESLANSYGSSSDFAIVTMKSSSNYQNVGPLVNTYWHQNNPYNSICSPVANHSAGCASVAMAQLMYYHKYPPSFSFSFNGYPINWNNVNIAGSPDTYYLIAFTGLASNTTYTSIGSWALPGNVVDGLRSMGYTVSRNSHDANGVKTQIFTYQRPVLMLGFNDLFLGIPNPNGHYWVCSGFDQTTSTNYYFIEFQENNGGIYSYGNYGYGSATYPEVIVYASVPYYYMNWGWGGTSKDGWFANNNVNPPGNNFQYARENFYINP